MLHLREVDAGYGQIRVLQRVSLSVERGEIVTLIGSNGAGKTTTMRTITGLLQAKQGSIEFDGEPIGGESPAHIVSRGIALVPEGRRIFPRLTVLENLLMGAYTCKVRTRRDANFQKVFELFPRLKDRQTQLGGTLSGGEQQMLAFGRALMSSPRMLLLDEPSMGLAPAIVQEVFHSIRQLNQEDGLTVFLVEQNARAALRIAHRGYVLESGQVKLTGPSADLLKNSMVQKAYLGV